MSLRASEKLLSRHFSAKTRTASNLAGNVYTAVVGFIFVPIYINYLGVEAYGIIGAFTGITSFVWLFDFGIATNINREMSSFSTTEDKRRLLDLKRTLEASIYAVSGVVFLLLLGFVYLVAHYWISTEKFSAGFMMSVMAILSFSLAVQFPTTFYSNGLIGLNQQVVLNGVTMLVNTARCVGAVVAIVLFEDRIRAFLIFQSLAALCGLLMLKLVFERAISTPEYRPRVDLSLLKKLRKFSSELFANNVVVIALTQADKVILSRMLSLEQFGYYMLAYNIVSMTISTFSNSVNNVLFPNLVRHVRSGDAEELKRSFHLGTRVMAWGAVTIGTVLVFLSEPILRVWTHNEAVVENAAPILAILAAAFAINITMLIPYYLQHAYGRSHVSFVFNVFAAVVYAPALILAATHYGAVGAAFVFLIVQSIYFLLFTPIIHRNFPSFDLWKYFAVDIVPPVLVGIGVGALSSMVFDNSESTVLALFKIGISGLLIATFTFFAARLTVLIPGRRSTF